MKNLYSTDALFTDFYELTMAQGYWKNGMNPPVVFDVFFRRQPWNGGFSVFCGIKTLLRRLETFSFSDEDITYLGGIGIFDKNFLTFLRSFRFSGDIYALPEGEIIFPQEVLVRIHAPLIEAQIIEGLVLNECNFQSLIATKTCRVWLAAAKGNVMEFGLRRAQGSDGAISASRASFVGGANGTSNTLAGKLYDIPVMGTMAHSWIMSFPSEEAAFEAYAELYPDKCIFLIDTYDTLKSGIKNAIKVGARLAQKGYNFGVRLDSGDMSYLTKAVRHELDAAGFPDAYITVSNDLTEEIVETLRAENAPIASWGVGTNMVTGGSEAAFTGVYKLAAKKDGDAFVPAMKFSDNPSKTTNPGIKNVFRLYDAQGMAKADILALSDEVLREGREYTYYHTMVDYRHFSFSAQKIRPLLTKQMEGGVRCDASLSPQEELKQSRRHMMEEIEKFDPSYKRMLNPHIYKVSMTENLKDLKLSFIEKNLR